MCLSYTEVRSGGSKVIRGALSQSTDTVAPVQCGMEQSAPNRKELTVVRVVKINFAFIQGQ